MFTHLYTIFTSPYLTTGKYFFPHASPLSFPMLHWTWNEAPFKCSCLGFIGPILLSLDSNIVVVETKSLAGKHEANALLVPQGEGEISPFHKPYLEPVFWFVHDHDGAIWQTPWRGTRSLFRYKGLILSLWKHNDSRSQVIIHQWKPNYELYIPFLLIDCHYQLHTVPHIFYQRPCRPGTVWSVSSSRKD